ncbi:MAG: isoleucine--tRNA ligase, partial [Nanoarchaeota archaeon]
YATGHIHLGTALNKILKDVAMRSKRMQGYDVFDRPLYDTHGVPIEHGVEKEIGSKGKQDIEKYGVEKFVQRCKAYAVQYIDAMNSEFKNLGVWMDWDNAQFTFNDEYIEATWTAFKEADKKGLIYLGKYPVHVCTRCQTAVAFNEIEYKKQKDTSVYVKFKVKGREKTYFIIFTTTPWTLPGNTGIMVNPNSDYQEIETSDGEKWIIAKNLVSNLMAKAERGFTPIKEFKGSEMKGWKYESPLSKFINIKIKKAYEVVLSGKYVNAEDGTGLVHCAPGHGKEDYEVGRENGLDMPCPVGIDGILTDETGKYSGKMARIVDKEIIEDLKNENALVFKENYEHDYPICWRDKTPLLMLSLPQWFFKISEIKEQLLKENNKNNWIPSWAKLRMKAWLEGISDWPISRQRYWGTPLPIWINEESGDKIIVGSIEELRKLSGVKNIELHKPEIDKILIKKNGKIYKRVSEVLDVWFDSGVSSWAILDYPRDKKKIKKYWPVDINIEGTDQFRGWWNSQIILSYILFGKKPFDSIMVHGMILDISKRKMSKSLGNIITPEDIINKYSRDFLRYYLTKFSKGGLDFSYDENELKSVKRFVNILNNIETFFNQIKEMNNNLEIEDKWIISKYNSLIKEVIECYNKYDFADAVTLIEDFTINNFSRDYIKLIRDRADEVYSLLIEINLGLIKLISPVMPFLSEMVWSRMREKKIVVDESITLAGFPKFIKSKIDESLEKDFEKVFKFIEMGLAERDKAKIGLRWPLASATIKTKTELNEDLSGLILRQLNIKKIKFNKSDEERIILDLKITPELEAEGYAREIARKIQSERKNRNMKKEERITLELYVSDRVKKFLQPHIYFISKRVGSVKVKFDEDKSKKMIYFDVKDEEIGFNFQRVNF